MTAIAAGKMGRGLAYTALFLSVAGTAGCLSDHTERVADVNPLGWSGPDTVWVRHDNADTISRRDLSLIVRWDGSMKQDSIRLSVTTVTPDSMRFTEEKTIRLGPVRVGHDLREALVPYRTASTLSKKGEYRFGFVPATPCKGVTAIGIRSDKQ